MSLNDGLRTHRKDFPKLSKYHKFINLKLYQIYCVILLFQGKKQVSETAGKKEEFTFDLDFNDVKIKEFNKYNFLILI